MTGCMTGAMRDAKAFAAEGQRAVVDAADAEFEHAVGVAFCKRAAEGRDAAGARARGVPSRFEIHPELGGPDRGDGGRPRTDRLESEPAPRRHEPARIPGRLIWALGAR